MTYAGAKDRLSDALARAARAFTDMADKAAAGGYHRSQSPLARQLEIASDLDERIAEITALIGRVRDGAFDIKPRK